MNKCIKKANQCACECMCVRVHVHVYLLRSPHTCLAWQMIWNMSFLSASCLVFFSSFFFCCLFCVSSSSVWPFFGLNSPFFIFLAAGPDHTHTQNNHQEKDKGWFRLTVQWPDSTMVKILQLYREIKSNPQIFESFYYLLIYAFKNVCEAKRRVNLKQIQKSFESKLISCWVTMAITFTLMRKGDSISFV